MPRLLAALLVCSFLAAPTRAHEEGNGQGQAYIAHTPVRIGGTVTIDFGSPGLAFGQALLVVAGSPAPTIHPQLGIVCLDLPNAMVPLSPLLDVNGNASTVVSVPNLPQLIGFAPAYGLALVVDFSIPVLPISISKTVRFTFEQPDGYNPAGSMTQPRALHTATALHADAKDNTTRILVAGGGSGTILAPVATDSTEIYHPLTRSFVSGPTMAVERALHQTVRLADGRALIIGGVDTIGNCQTSCELFDPATETLTATGSLAVARAGHQATLLNDGRVLVTGGVTTFVGGSTNLPGVLNTAQSSAEVYDPMTGLWTTLASAMTAGRFGHAQTLLANGMVLVTGGINGGTTFLGQGIPTYTASCNLFNPSTDLFAATGSLPQARAGHAQSQLTNGNVVATGGIRNVFFVPTAVADVTVWNGSTWSGSASLPSGVAFHSQLASTVDGAALIKGGISGSFLALGASSLCGRHNGTTYTATAAFATNSAIAGSTAQAIGSHQMVRVYDGSYLIVGGADSANTFSSAFSWIE